MKLINFIRRPYDFLRNILDWKCAINCKRLISFFSSVTRTRCGSQQEPDHGCRLPPTGPCHLRAGTSTTHGREFPPPPGGNLRLLWAGTFGTSDEDLRPLQAGTFAHSEREPPPPLGWNHRLLRAWTSIALDRDLCHQFLILFKNHQPPGGTGTYATISSFCLKTINKFLVLFFCPFCSNRREPPPPAGTTASVGILRLRVGTALQSGNHHQPWEPPSQGGNLDTSVGTTAPDGNRPRNENHHQPQNCQAALPSPSPIDGWG